jgi:acetyltransferase
VKSHAKNEGEVAVLISDVSQNQGLGTELFRRVIQVARDEKLARVDAEILPDNLSMKKIAKRLGFRVGAFEDPTSLRAVLEL